MRQAGVVVARRLLFGHVLLLLLDRLLNLSPRERLLVRDCAPHGGEVVAVVGWRSGVAARSASLRDGAGFGTPA